MCLDYNTPCPTAGTGGQNTIEPRIVTPVRYRNITLVGANKNSKIVGDITKNFTDFILIFFRMICVLQDTIHVTELKPNAEKYSSDLSTKMMETLTWEPIHGKLS